jgi:hypothetical protein
VVLSPVPEPVVVQFRIGEFNTGVEGGVLKGNPFGIGLRRDAMPTGFTSEFVSDVLH